jgi:Rrf2 family protein
MAHLAEQPPGRFLSSREICDHEDIPPSFLGKVFLPLCRCRMLRSLRGIGGGYELAVPPDQIRLLAIVQAIDGSQLDDCVLEDHACGNPRQCLLHPIWAAVRQQFLDYLQNTTVADLARMRKSTSLSIPAAKDTPEAISSTK